MAKPWVKVLAWWNVAPILTFVVVVGILLWIGFFLTGVHLMAQVNSNCLTQAERDEPAFGITQKAHTQHANLFWFRVLFCSPG